MGAIGAPRRSLRPRSPHGFGLPVEILAKGASRPPRARLDNLFIRITRWRGTAAPGGGGGQVGMQMEAAGRGPPGSFKAPLAFRILYRQAIDHGASCLYLSMEQSRGSLAVQMASLGMDPAKAKGVHVIDVRALRRELEEIREQPRWLLGLRRQLGRYKEETGCDLLAIDSLDALYALTPFENPRNEIFQFFEELRELEATTFLVSEMARDSSRLAQFGVEEFLADTIVHLRLREVDSGMSTSVRRYLAVVQMRGGAPDLDY